MDWTIIEELEAKIEDLERRYKAEITLERREQYAKLTKKADELVEIIYGPVLNNLSMNDAFNLIRELRGVANKAVNKTFTARKRQGRSS
tara:strand:- start:2831 stop:3097 length:267 start_codon:yes stop_codon:yes gene_type:complete